MSLSEHNILECPVCFLMFDNPLILQCGHTICSKCVNSLVKYNQISCPICREFSYKQNLIKNFIVRELVEFKKKSIDENKSNIISEIKINDSKTKPFEPIQNVKRIEINREYDQIKTVDTSTCIKCYQKFKPGTQKFEYNNQAYHENCFKCNLCTKNIGTDKFFTHQNDIYCKRCYQEFYLPKCNLCNQTILESVLHVGKKCFHEKCFMCEGCHEQLSGRSFHTENESHYCNNCYGILFAKKCSGCTKPIMGSNMRYVIYEDRNWHNDCFKCVKCRVALNDIGFYTKGSDILCSICSY